MDFLIIGNGFDIAHNLPTKYTEFLSFCQNYDEKNPVTNIAELNKEFSIFIEHNIWLKYFLKLTGLYLHRAVNKTWIDFEKEVSEIIQIIENDLPEIKRDHRSKDPNGFTFKQHGTWRTGKLECFLSGFGEYNTVYHTYALSAENVTDLNSFIEYLYVQLRKFARAFEIYCLKINQTDTNEPIIFSERGMQIKKVEAERVSYWKQICGAEEHHYDNVDKLKLMRDEADDRYNHLMSEVRPIDYLSMGRFAYVLSFNYTDTYERLYGDSKTKYCYIHGKAQENKERTNLILGIDDNLSDGKESSNFQCVKFKKYYQRILFKTGSEYKDWLALGPKQLPSTNYVHIVGHSLDRTDHDVLYEFFSDKRFRIIVYYYSQKDFEDKIQNVIRLLAYNGGNGRNELIRRVHGQQWTIKFAYLYDEKEGLFKAPAAIVEEPEKVKV